MKAYIQILRCPRWTVLSQTDHGYTAARGMHMQREALPTMIMWLLVSVPGAFGARHGAEHGGNPPRVATHVSLTSNFAPN